MANLAEQVNFLLSGIRDDSGNVLASGKVYFYEPGTTTDKTVWTDHTKATPAAQPVVLDSAGKALIYAHGAYRVKIETSADVAVDDYDNLIFQRNQLVDPLTLDSTISLSAGDFTVDTDTMFVDSTNNRVGIGTITPGTDLHIENAAGVTLKLDGDSDNNGTNDDVQIQYFLNGSIAFSTGIDDSDSDLFKISAGAVGTNDILKMSSAGVTVPGTLTVTGDAAFDTNTLFVDVSANSVGMGTITPSAQLHIVGSDVTDQVIIESTDEGANTAPDLVLYKNSASPSTADAVGKLEFRANDDGLNDTVYGAIQVQTPVITDGSEGGEMLFFTTQSGTSTQVLQLDQGGSVAIGTAAIATTATDGFLYIPSCAGAPTGTPTAKTGRVPIVYDSTNNKIYIYDGSWLATSALT